MSQLVPVLEIGGTHVSAALVDPDGWRVPEVVRLAVDGDAPSDAIVGRFLDAASRVAAPDSAVWGVAMPDPFDYASGVAWFEGVGKFAALRGVDVHAALLAGIAPRPAEVVFLNDADAFTLGEWVDGAAAGAARVTGLTLGTGVGTGWLVDGRVVDPGEPPEGRAHRLAIDGVPLEDAVSRRAVRRRYREAGGDPDADVREIAEAARAGEPRAAEVIVAAFGTLGRALGPSLAGFAPDVLVVGGSMAASWDLFDGPFRSGADLGAALPEVRLARDGSGAPLRGAAVHAARR